MGMACFKGPWGMTTCLLQTSLENSNYPEFSDFATTANQQIAEAEGEEPEGGLVDRQRERAPDHAHPAQLGLPVPVPRSTTPGSGCSVPETKPVPVPRSVPGPLCDPVHDHNEHHRFDAGCGDGAGLLRLQRGRPQRAERHRVGRTSTVSEMREIPQMACYHFRALCMSFELV